MASDAAPVISAERMRGLLAPYLQGHSLSEGDWDLLLDRLGVYLELLQRWNARTNLTTVRQPELIVTRHFGESLFAGACLRATAGDMGQLLDLGSGAGFPGLPMQLLLPGWQVTLAESQGKKAAFLREAVRVLGLQTEVWSGRVEAMPADRLFDAVALRAVDRMEQMVEVARTRIGEAGQIVELRGGPADGEGEWLPMPGSTGSYVRLRQR